MLRFIFFLTLLMLSNFTEYAFGLSNDRAKKIFIMGDYALLNYKTGIHTFEGHVKVDQGTTHVIADKIQTANNNQHQIKQVTAYGLQALAHFWTLPKEGDDEVHAHAKIIKFYPQSSNATLEQNAIVVQGKNSFQGDRVLYNMHDQTITVPASKNGRAILIYDPDESKKQ